MNRFFTSIILVATILLSACAAAADLTVTEAWARPAAAGQNSAIYFQIHNESDSDEILLRVDADLARAVEMHLTMAMELESDEMDGMIDSANGGMEMGDVLQMLPQERVGILAGASVSFQAGGLHVMMIDLDAALNDGDHFPITLIFESGLRLDVDVEVQSP